MSCPFNEKPSPPVQGKLLYSDYLRLDKVLNAQIMQSANVDSNNPAYDEHLFIIIHQTYELWFKEILYELDLVRDEFSKENLNFSEVIKRLNRIVMILKLLVDQVLILETMAPMDFNDFRQHLDTASGFQSMQFRLIENKLGLRHENRVKFNQGYSSVFKSDENVINEIQKSISTPSLLQLIEKWLEHIPHLDSLWKHYKQVVENHVLRNYDDLQGDDKLDQEKNGILHKVGLIAIPKDDKNDTARKKIREQFDTIFNQATHEALLKRGERKMSLRALHAAIIINLYKNEELFSTSNQILTLLVDCDAMLSRWRYNHVLLVQRMIGSAQLGTGGSSGYQYLRSTLSDRYKPFVDLSNLTTFLINKTDLAPITQIICVTKHDNQRKKGRQSTRHENGNGKRSCNGRQLRCHHCSNYLNISENKAEKDNQRKRCNVCSELGKSMNARNFQQLSVSLISEDEKKDMESSFESTSSISSTVNHSI